MTIEETEMLKYVANCVGLAQECIERGDYDAGVKHLEAAGQALKERQKEAR